MRKSRMPRSLPVKRTAIAVTLLFLLPFFYSSPSKIDGPPPPPPPPPHRFQTTFTSSKTTDQPRQRLLLPSPPPPPPLEYDHYRHTCPDAESTVRSAVTQILLERPTVGPALLRLLFHDCFIHGCDASLLLEAVDGAPSERDAIPNLSLRGFDTVDAIKSSLERICPAVVSCSDILVLAARDAVLSKGLFYPLSTGRKDGTRPYHDLAQDEIPSPDSDVSKTLTSFARRGFTARETVALLGAHSIGTVHCRFFADRLYNYNGTGAPDATLDEGLLDVMRRTCANVTATLSSPSEVEGEPGVAMEGGFDGGYYQSLVGGRGTLRADQQLTSSERTVRWVRAYASVGGGTVFRRDFARAMVKLSGLGVLSGSQGEVRLNCSRVR